MRKKGEVEKFEGAIYIAVIYKKARVYYALAEEGGFFRISDYEAERIPCRKKVPRTPINFGYESMEIKDGQRVSFESLKKTRGKNRWAKNIRLLGLGKLI